jgi:hypothetical protein
MKELFAALVKAQAEMTGAKKDSANPFFKSKYADLGSVMEAIRPALSAHGLGFVQMVKDGEDCAAVETVIIHESGEMMPCGYVSVPVSKADAQGYGSAITYAKRYSLQAAFGVPSIDDDGNAAAAAKPDARAPHGYNAKGNPKAGPEAHSPAKLAFESLPPDTQDYLRSVAADVILLLSKSDDKGAWERIEDEAFDADCKAGLWSLLDSKQRSALKTQAAAAAQKVTQ